VTEKRRRRPPTPALPRLRRDEIPGIRADSRPYATAALVLAGMIGTVLWRTSLGPDQLAVIGKPGSQWWRLLSAPFIYENTGYAFVTLGAIGLFGWLLERRHGRVPVLVLFAIGAVGGTAVTAAAYPVPVVLGANGAALALVVAWAVPDLLALRAGEDIDGDLIGTGVIAALVALMPLVAHASWLSDAVGALAGLGVGWLLARPYRR
jgi:membrane associated rhomboid family serine protease